MPTRRSSPRRSATRPSAPFDPDDDDAAIEPGGRLASATPWLALGAALIAIIALAATLLGRGTDLGACRSAAWGAVPAAGDLPTGWTLSTTDLNANGMTVSILGPASTDGSTDQPVVYASVTCYGDVAGTALTQYRDAALAAGAKISDRGRGGAAYDVDNQATGSVTTLFRVGALIGQVANAGSVAPAELATITSSVASAMGDRAAAGAAGSSASGAGPSDAASGDEASLEPVGSDDAGASAAPSAPELERHLPTEVAGTPLTIQSGSASDGLGLDPNSRALAAAIRGLGAELTNLQLAQAADETGGLDLDIFAFRLAGGSGTELRTAVIDSWLSAGAPGVKQTAVQLAGKPFTKIDYGDGGRIDYVLGGTDYVIVVETSDAAIATEVAGKLK